MYTREYILERLNAMAEKNYADFSTALIPGEKRMLGVRIPGLRAFAREIARNDYRDYFANAGVLEDSSLPDDITSCRKKDIFDIKEPYFEEYALTGFVIGYIKADFDYVIRLVAAFVPGINNWSVNDTFCATLKITEKNRKKMWDFLYYPASTLHNIWHISGRQYIRIPSMRILHCQQKRLGIRS